MEINFNELRDWSNDARRALDREREKLMEQMRLLDGLARATEAIDEVLSENERLQTETADLNEQLEQKEQEIDELQRQLLEAKNQLLETERQQLETEVRAKPMEIHNHFEPGSSSQVFNDQVSGKFTRTPSDKSMVNKNRKDIRRSKKKWKKTIRKML